MIVMVPWLRYGIHPVGLAGRRVERAHPPGVPHDQLTCPAHVDNGRRTVARFHLGRQRPPELFARPFVERDDHRIGLAADQANQPVAVHQRRGGKAKVKPPVLSVHVVVGDVILLPQGSPVLTSRASSSPARPRTNTSVAIDGGDGARALVPADAAVIRVPFPGPEDLAGLFVQRQRALGSVADASCTQNR